MHPSMEIMSMSIENRFNVINEWLRFAEAKNAAIIALSSVLLSVITPWSPELENTVFAWYLWVAFFGVGLALIIALVSFLPFTDRNPFLTRLVQEKTAVGEKNWTFFGDIASSDFDEFTLALKARGENLEDVNTREIAEQIYINSRICTFKLNLFKFCVFVIIGALFTPIVAFLIWPITQQGRGDV